MDDNERVMDVVRVMRKETFWANGERRHDVERYVREYADRIEAAWKRDKSDAIKTAMMCKCEVCRDVQENKAALRQELETLVGRMESFAADCGDETLAMNIRLYGRGIRRILSNAAPARNCDVGTAEEQVARYRAFCAKMMKQNNHCCGPCPCYKFVNGEAQSCTLLWAQMPYEKKED